MSVHVVMPVHSAHMLWLPCRRDGLPGGGHHHEGSVRRPGAQQLPLPETSVLRTWQPACQAASRGSVHGACALVRCATTAVPELVI
jgi:hypothetical protein